MRFWRCSLAWPTVKQKSKHRTRESESRRVEKNDRDKKGSHKQEHKLRNWIVLIDTIVQWIVAFGEWLFRRFFSLSLSLASLIRILIDCAAHLVGIFCLRVLHSLSEQKMNRFFLSLVSFTKTPEVPTPNQTFVSLFSILPRKKNHFFQSVKRRNQLTFTQKMFTLNFSSNW